MDIRSIKFNTKKRFNILLLSLISAVFIFCLVTYAISVPKTQDIDTTSSIGKCIVNDSSSAIVSEPVQEPTSNVIFDTLEGDEPETEISDSDTLEQPDESIDISVLERPIPEEEDFDNLLPWQYEEPTLGLLEIDEKKPDTSWIHVPEDFIAFTRWSYHNNTYTFKLEEDWQYYTYQMAEKYGVSHRIIFGIMGVETGWDIYWGPKNGYVGVGCINEYYGAKSFKEKGIDIYTPEGNIEAICSIIASKLALYHGNIHYALMAYNGGDDYVARLVEQGDHSTLYSRKVVEIAESFQ